MQAQPHCPVSAGPLIDVDGCFAAVTNGRALIGDLRAIRASWDDRMNARCGADTWRIADLLLAPHAALRR